jgi:hypothetical protein
MSIYVRREDRLEVLGRIRAYLELTGRMQD